MSTVATRVRRPTPPGEVIKEELDARGWTIDQFAKILGRPRQVVSAIINGRKAITPQTAVELGAAFETSSRVWIGLEMSYRISLVEPPDPAIAERAREAEASAR